MRPSSSAAPPPRPQKNAAVAAAPSLPPNKVAELVRKLAEAQIETRRLRDCMDKVQRENESLQTISSAQQQAQEHPKLPQQRQESKHQSGGCYTKAFVTTNIDNSDTVNNNETTNVGSSVLLEEKVFLDQVGSAPSTTIGLLPPHIAERKANQSPQGGTAAEGKSESQQWKRKYVKLKRAHTQEMLERDAQLAEVQHLVYQIHEEHDALRHRNERDLLQQQLVQESHERAVLEQRARALEEEAVGWRQRYLRLVEEAAACSRVASRPEGLNQTDPFFFSDGAPEQPQQQQQQQQQQQHQPPQQHSVGVMSTPPRQGRGDCSAQSGLSPRPVRGSVREVSGKSIAVQSDARTVMAASTQTEGRNRRTMGIQTETTSGVARERAGDSPGPSEEQRLMEAIRPRVRSAAVIPYRGNAVVDFAVPWTARREGPVDHRYAPAHGSGDAIANAAEPECYAPSLRRSFLGEGETNVVGASVPVTRNESSAPVLFAASNAYDQSKRERLEEDIRRHDHLLEAVAKLQRQAQRAAKRPSL